MNKSGAHVFIAPALLIVYGRNRLCSDSARISAGTPACSAVKKPSCFPAENCQRKSNPAACFPPLSRIKIASPRGSLSVKGAVIARAPACLRVEMFAFLNQLAFLFATDGSIMSFFLPAQNSFYTGKAADEHLSFLYGTDIRMQDATALFLGYPRILPYDGRASYLEV